MCAVMGRCSVRPGLGVVTPIWPQGAVLQPHGSLPTQVKSVNLSDGEVLSIRGVDDDTLVVLANQTLLVEGQVIRSPTNTISVYFRTFQDEAVGTFQLHYQGGCLGPMGASSAACRVGTNGSPCPAGMLGLIATRVLLAPFLPPFCSSSCTGSR